MPGLPVLDLEIIKCRVLLISNFSQWRCQKIVFPPGSPAYTLFGTGFWECWPWLTLTKLTGRYQQGRNVVGVGVDLIIVVIGVINDDSSCLSSPLSFVKSKGDCDGCWRGQSWRNLHHWGSLDKNSCWLMLGNTYHRKTLSSLSLAFSRIWTPKDPDLLILSGASSLCIRFFYFYSFFLQYSLLSSAWKGAFWKRRESVCIQWGV